MQKIIWILAILALAVWSLIAWGLSALVTGSGDVLAPLASSVPVLAEWKTWIDASFAWAAQFGAIAVWIMWGIGAFLVAALAAIASVIVRVVRRAGGSGVGDKMRGAFAGLR